MPAIDTVKQYKFPWPNEDKGYKVFPPDMESDTHIAFHGTTAARFSSILNDGFKAQGELLSISFAKDSSLSLGYACGKRSLGAEGVVIAVRLQHLNPPCVHEEVSCIYLYCQDQQPEIIGYCIVPANYDHR
ncbi:MAG: hypothetical protein AABY68_00185 [Pseudomonadota bacterium]